jgi:hypothetical protein
VTTQAPDPNEKPMPEPPTPEPDADADTAGDFPYTTTDSDGRTVTKYADGRVEYDPPIEQPPLPESQPPKK